LARSHYPVWTHFTAAATGYGCDVENAGADRCRDWGSASSVIAAEAAHNEKTTLERPGSGLGGSDIEASKCVLPQEADCRDSVEGNGYPHATQLCKLQSDMNVLDPKGGASGGYSFNSPDTKSACVYPDLPP